MGVYFVQQQGFFCLFYLSTRKMSLLRSVSESPCWRSAGVGLGFRSGILSSQKTYLLGLGVRRSLATTSARCDALKSKEVNERASKGAEGLHFVDAAGAKAVKHDTTTHSDIPVVMGDWVLFHPVYSDNELHSVQVSYTPSTHLFHCPSYTLWRRYFIANQEISKTSSLMAW